MDTKSLHCPNCSAPITVPLGEVEHYCEYCGSHLRLMPSGEEMEVVRTREEMKSKERVAVQQQVLRNQLEQEEMDRWRQVAGRVAIASLPVVGRAAGSAMFRAVATRGSGCAGCGCVILLGAIVAAAALLAGLLR